MKVKHLQEAIQRKFNLQRVTMMSLLSAALNALGLSQLNFAF